jgi:hypothetical protein
MSSLRWISILWFISPIPIIGIVANELQEHRDTVSIPFPFFLTAGSWLLSYAFRYWRGYGIRLSVGVLSAAAILVAVVFMMGATFYSRSAFAGALALYGFGIICLGIASLACTFFPDLWTSRPMPLLTTVARAWYANCVSGVRAAGHRFRSFDLRISATNFIQRMRRFLRNMRWWQVAGVIVVGMLIAKLILVTHLHA